MSECDKLWEQYVVDVGGALVLDEDGTFTPPKFPKGLCAGCKMDLIPVIVHLAKHLMDDVEGAMAELKVLATPPLKH